MKIVISTSAPTEPKDRHFEPSRCARTDQAKALVADVLKQVQNYEKHLRLRKRARKAKDQLTFERQIESLVCDMAYQEIANPSGFINLSLSKRVLGMKDRYKSKVLCETLPDLIRSLSSRELEFAVMELGIHNTFVPSFSKQTTVRAGKMLTRRIHERGLALLDFSINNHDGELIKLKDVKSSDYWKKDKAKLMAYEDTEVTIRYREEMVAINAYLAAADIEVYVDSSQTKTYDTTDRRMSRTFNRASFEEGGRLYGGFWQPMKSEDREDVILINGDNVVCLDYGQIVVRILYGLAGATLHCDDAYTIPGLEDYRAGIKLVMNIMFNVSSMPTQKPKDSKYLLPRHMTMAQIIRIITDYHSEIAPYFFTNRGLHVQFLESRILITLLGKLRDLGIVALPVHDAVIVSVEDSVKAEQVMLSVFLEATGVQGTVSCD